MLQPFLYHLKSKMFLAFCSTLLLSFSHTIFGQDLARGKTVAVSSQESSSYSSSYAVDGNSGTRWSSNYSDTQWIRIDLGAVTTVNRVVLNWEVASARNYNVDISNDGSSWRPLTNRSNMSVGARRDDLTGFSGSGRYVRMTGTARTSQYGYSLWDFEVYGPGTYPNQPELLELVVISSSQIRVTWKDNSTTEDGFRIERIGPGGFNYTTVGSVSANATSYNDNGLQSNTSYSYRVVAYNAVGNSPPSNAMGARTLDNNSSDLARGKTVTASSQESSAHLPSNVVDGTSSTRWASLYSDPQWIRIDLGTVYSINRVILNWEFASARDYRIEISNDGSSWSPVTNRSGMSTGARKDDLSGLSGSGRYIRMYGTARTSQYGYSLWDFEVYGSIPTPSIQLSSSNYTVGESGTSVTVTVNRSGNSDGQVSVDYFTTAGSALPGQDYTNASGTLTFASGVTTQNFSVPIINDSEIEQDETFSVTLRSRLGGVTIGNPGSAVVTITDDDNLAQRDLAVGKRVAVSSQESSLHVPSYAVDANSSTRWASAYSDSQWIRIDLGEVYSINRVVLNWEFASARDYRIELSNDGSSWSPLTNRSNMSQGARKDDLRGFSGSGRYIRMYGTARTSQYGYSLWDFEVYGSNPILQVRTRYNAMILNYNPRVRTPDGQYLHIDNHWRFKNVDSLAAAYCEIMRRASGGQVNFTVANRYELNEFPPQKPGHDFTYTPENYLSLWEQRREYRLGNPDYANIVRDQRFNIYDKVNNQQIDAIWVFGIPGTGFWETSMGGEGAYWVNGETIDEINTGRKFVVFGFGKESHQGVGFMFENTAHMVENIFGRNNSWPRRWSIPTWNTFDLNDSGRRLENRFLNDWEYFILSDVNHFDPKSTSYGHAQAGISHYPPPALHNYDWSSHHHLEWDRFKQSQYGGNWQNMSNEVRVNSGYGHRAIAIDREDREIINGDTIIFYKPIITGDFDCNIGISVQDGPQNSHAGVLLRASAYNSISICKAYYVGINARADRLFIAKLINNQIQELAGVNCELIAGTMYQFRIEVLGNRLSVYLENETTPKVSVIDNSYSIGAVGYITFDTDAAFRPMRILPSALSGADRWRTYPQLSGDTRRLTPEMEWEGQMESFTTNDYFFSWWYEQIPKNMGTHQYTDLQTGVLSHRILNSWWPYIWDINTFNPGMNISTNVISAPIDNIRPEVPRNIICFSGNNKVELAWDEPYDNIGVTRYEIRRDGEVIKRPCMTKYIDNGLQPNTTYLYTLAAIDGSGNRSIAAIIRATTTLIGNSSFEFGIGNRPIGWQADVFDPANAVLNWEDQTQGRNSTTCVSVRNTGANDARWIQEISGLVPNATYRMSGWIRGENINLNGGTVGANISIMGLSNHSPRQLAGTFPWTQVEFTFTAPANGTVQVACRLGFYGSTVTGKAWFDDVSLNRVP
jgi:hypothetical protein